MKAHNKLLSRYLGQKRSPRPESILLTPDGKVDSLGTFVIIIPSHRYEMHIFTLRDFETFADALSSCPIIEWHRSPTISCIHGDLFPILDNLELKLPNNKRDDYLARSFHISKEKALQLKITIPNDITMRRLKEEDAEGICKVWPYGGTPEALQEVLDYIYLYEGVGLVKKDTEELVAWCMFGEYGGPAILQVSESHKGKGYGEICLKAMTIYAAEKGFDSHAFVTPNNVASMSLFKKIGHQAMYPGSWTTFTAIKN